MIISPETIDFRQSADSTCCELLNTIFRQMFHSATDTHQIEIQKRALSTQAPLLLLLICELYKKRAQTTVKAAWLMPAADAIENSDGESHKFEYGYIASTPT